MKNHRAARCFLLGTIFAFGLTGARHASAQDTKEPEIVGSARFTAQIHSALLLIKNSDKNAYAIIMDNVGRIQEGERSGMWAYKTPPTYEVSDTTAFASLTWCAATIAHDSFHSKLYHDYKKAHPAPKGAAQKSTGDEVPDAIWTGTSAERLCMSHQIAVMKRIGAPQREIDYAIKQSDGSYVKDKETWDDYKKRKW